MDQISKLYAKTPNVNISNSSLRIQRNKSSQPLKSPADQILFLQRTIGNQAVQRLIKSGKLQTKLRIGQLGDKYEQEADRVADAVMRMPQAVSSETPYIQRAIPTCGEEELQRQPIEEEEELQAKPESGHIYDVNPHLESQIQVIGMPTTPSVLQAKRASDDWSVVRDPGNRVTLEVDGRLLSTHHIKPQVGVSHGKRWSDVIVAVDPRGNVAAMIDAHIGTLKAGGKHHIYRVKRGRLKSVPGEFEVMLKGRSFGALENGEQILKTTSGKPVKPDKMPTEVKSSLVPSQSTIWLERGSYMWVYMEFAYRGESRRKGRWARSKTFSQIESSQKELAEEAEKLPAGQIKDRVERFLPLISAVSAHEGSFGAVSPSSDPMASLGIFQWGAEKSKSVRGYTSLYPFFRNLHDRSQEAKVSKVSGVDISEEQQFYIDAWGQAASRGLGFKGDQLTLNGKTVTGKILEKRMRREMATGALKTYQLVASLDWIENFKKTVIRPGVWGKSKIGNKYKEPAGSKGGGMVHLTQGKTTVEVTADDYLTVGDVFNTQKNLTKAVILGVNRPHFVETALWIALNPGNTKVVVTENMRVLHREIRAAVSDGRLSRKNIYNEADIAIIGSDAQASYDALKLVLWPNPLRFNRVKLVGEFEAQAMKLYKAKGAKKFHRERRFATVEAIFGSKE